jgi:hypothetical protein
MFSKRVVALKTLIQPKEEATVVRQIKQVQQHFFITNLL